MIKKEKYASYWHAEDGTPMVSSRMRERLVKAWKAGLNNREVAIHCSIPMSFLLELLSSDEKLRMRAEGLQEHTKIQAKINVADAIEKGRMKTSQWYLERKCPEEYSTKQDVLLSGNLVTASEEEKEKAVKELIDQLTNA